METDIMPIRAEYFLRQAHVPGKEPKTIIAGLLTGHLTPLDMCQLHVGHIILLPKRRFILPDKYEGWRIEDLLLESFDTADLEEMPDE